MTVFDAWTLDTELIELAKKLLQELVQFCTDFSVRFDIKDSSWQQCNGATVNGDGQDTSTYKCKLKQNYHQSQWWLAENATNVCAKMQKSDIYTRWGHFPQMQSLQICLTSSGSFEDAHESTPRWDSS